ncbi:SNF2/helicase domain-containing protein [Corallococcus coralloides]|uniref:SNF2/helicase domain-containing protein n=1 Tax=Corallococcus coralloides TaxID=184914 RepID=A0A410RP91_CORCK|nr:DEAD/DEAH box helicase [Corallococcus coralloides]QAT83712.1 SNF2/helicase domain-containing protein [Corallococcus coralloides]
MQAVQTTADTRDPLSPQDGLWLRALKAEVEPATFKKGREVAEGRRVFGLTREPERIRAQVAAPSGERYDVALIPGEGKVVSSCTCPVWNTTGPHCEHVVAVALIYAARFRPPPPPQKAAAPPPPPPEPEDMGPDDEEEIPGGGAPGMEGVSLPALAKVESWLGLSSLPDYEFLYRLTPASSGAGGSNNRHWVVDVRRQDAQTKGPVHVKRLLQAGSRIAPADERIFMVLSRHEHRYDSRIVLSDEDLCEVLELLRQRRVIYRGTPLVYMEQPVRPQIHLESRPDGATAQIELLFPDGVGYPLKDVIVLAGRRTYVIQAQNLHAVEPDFPPRLLRKWLLEPTMAFPSGQLDRVLTFFAAHLPRFRMSLKADDIEVDESVEPRFVLTLEGAAERVKVQLAARYGQTTVAVSPTATHLGYASGVGEDARKLYRRRDEVERAAGKLLLDQGLRFDQAAQAFDASGDVALEFWARGLASLPAEWERYGVSAPKVRLRPKLKPRIRVGMSGVQWFDLDAEFVTDDQAVDLGAVRMWLDSGRKFIPLKDGSFAEADVAEIKRVADLLEEAGAMPGRTRTRLPLHQAVALDLLADLGEFTEVEAKARQAMLALRESAGVPKVAVPEGLQATLRHYQEAGLSWLWFLRRHGLSGILADDMGLGKTIQSLSLMQKVANDEGRKPSLVVAPTSVLANWEREAERFTPGLKAMVWHGQDRRERAEDLKGMDLVLTSYALVRRDLEQLSQVGFRYVILDEAQNIKNADSATAQACKSLPSETRLALTGTPLENRLSELWSIFDFLMPGFLGSAEGFSDRYEQPIQVANDATAKDRLRRRIQPFIMRRLKTEVAKDLPPKTESVAWCEMEPGQAALYREVLEESRRKVNESIEKVGFKRSRVSILAALMRLRQVCCDPRLLKMPPGTLLPSSAKLERFMELVADLVAEGHRALVFSQFTEMLELLKQEADKKGLRYLYLDGRTKDRMGKVDEYNRPDGPPLFFISLKAGGTGLNLTAADYVIHFDPWWNPAVEDQATDRTHRIGQTRAVISYKLITRGTVEEKILSLQRRKRELAAGVLGTDGDDMGRTLTEQDIQELFTEI